MQLRLIKHLLQETQNTVKEEMENCYEWQTGKIQSATPWHDFHTLTMQVSRTQWH